VQLELQAGRPRQALLAVQLELQAGRPRRALLAVQLELQAGRPRRALLVERFPHSQLTCQHGLLDPLSFKGWVAPLLLLLDPRGRRHPLDPQSCNPHPLGRRDQSVHHRLLHLQSVAADALQHLAQDHDHHQARVHRLLELVLPSPLVEDMPPLL